MRKDVKKFLFLGPSTEKELFFKRAQELGIIHFIENTQVSQISRPEDIEKTKAAIKVLTKLPLGEQEENFNILSLTEITDKILQLSQRDQKCCEDLRIISLEIARIAVFGRFSLEEIAYIQKEGNRVVQFFCGKSKILSEELPKNLIYIASEHNLAYYISINQNPVIYDKLVEIKVQRSLKELQEKNTYLERERQNIREELHYLTRYNRFLHYALLKQLNQYHLYQAQNHVKDVMDGALFTIEGWVPITKLEQLDVLLAPLLISKEEVAINPKDKVPTYLEYKGRFELLGGALISVYDTPSKTDKDPAQWVLWSFALFFAFIINDAGYGLIYLGIALFLHYKLPHLKGIAKTVLNLFTVLSVGCIIWGVLVGSFFGIEMGLDNPLRKLSLVDWLEEKKVAYIIEHQDVQYQEWLQKYPALKDVSDPKVFLNYVPPHAHDPVILQQMSNSIMFEMALFIGVMHLVLSLLRYAGRHWQNIGWAIFLIGGYLYFADYLKTPTFLNFVGGIDLKTGGQVGLQLMIGGIGLSWIASIFLNGWQGIFEVFTLIQVFADTLSYLRLYALGLAGAILAETINEAALNLSIVPSIILIVLSHCVNIALGTVSGVLHGLRLNFLEWYHYSFEGGGKEFQPLSILEQD